MTILLVFLFALLLYAIIIYNALIRLRAQKEEGWSGIDVQLKRRSDLIPRLVETIKGYTTHEKDLLTRTTEMRAKSMSATEVADRSVAESEVTGALTRLMVVAENYPDLKANENFLKLQADLAETEDTIQNARRYYNATVRELNIKVESFPSTLIAKPFKFEKGVYFELASLSERNVPKI